MSYLCALCYNAVSHVEHRKFNSDLKERVRREQREREDRARVDAQQVPSQNGSPEDHEDAVGVPEPRVASGKE